MADARKNFAYSHVATAPSPASSGTTLSFTAGEGGRMPATPFNAIVWPDGAIPLPTNAEIVRITTLSGDNVTVMTRTQEGSSARSIVVGDQIMAGITSKMFSDIEALLPVAPTHLGSYSPAVNAAAVANQAYLVPLLGVITPTSISRIAWGLSSVVAGNYDVGIYYSDDESTFTRLASLGSTAIPAVGNILSAIAAQTLTPVAGRRWYLGLVLSTASGISMAAPGAAQVHGVPAFIKASSFPLPASLTGMSGPGATGVPAMSALI